ncbi:MAG TPA: Spy/CpxP family protein refolding chaperone [Elusimicrobiales bacterium]|nr:Spy/CpxP family protein refolding chaperone [Elusimicrobiales bacterium]
MNIKWNQVSLAAAAGFLLGAVFANLYTIHHIPGRPPFGGGPGGGRHGAPMEMFTRELGLDEAQNEKISAIFEKYRPEMDKVMKSTEPQMEALRRRVKTEIDGILTPEQITKIEKLEKMMKPPHKGFAGRMPPPGPGGPGPR